jgi:exonuclease SbcC
MKKFIIVLSFLIVFSIIFGEITDVKPASPVYPHVFKVVNAGIMDTDTQGKFNGSISVSRYDLAIFGSKFLDYLNENYKKEIMTLDASLTKLEIEKLPERVYTLENFIFSLDADYKNTKNNVMDLSNRVKNLESAITIDSTDSNNPIFKAIAQNAYMVAEKKSEQKINELYETTLASIVLFSDRMNEFEKTVEEVLDQFSKTKEYMTNTLDDYLKREQSYYKSYIDELFSKEKDGLKLFITNEVSAQMRWKKSSEDSTLTQLINDINELKNQISSSNEYIDNIIQQKFDFQIKPLINLTSKIPELDNQIRELNDKVLQLETSGIKITDSSTLSNDTLLYKKLQEIENKTNDIPTLKTKIGEFEKVINSYNGILSDASNRINNLESKVIDLEKNISDIKVTANTQLPQALLDRLSNIEKRLDNMKTLENAADELNNFSKTLKEYDQRIALLEGAAFDKESDSISNLFSKIDKIEARINTNDYAVSNLTAQVLNMSKDLEDFRKAVKDSGVNNIGELLTNINSALPKINNLDQLSNKNYQEIQKINDQLKTIDELKAKDDELTKKIRDMNKLVQDLALQPPTEKLQNDVITNSKTLFELKSEFDKKVLQLDTLEERLKSLEKSIYNLENLPSNNKDVLTNIIGDMVSQEIMKKSDDIKDYVYMQIKDDLIKENMKSLESIITRLNNVEDKVNTISNSSYLDEKVINMEKDITNLKSQNNQISNELLEMKKDSSEVNLLESKVSKLEKDIHNQNIMNNILYSLIGGIVGGIAVYVVLGGM